MTTRMPSFGALAAIVIFALSVFGFTLFVWKAFGGTSPLAPEGYRVHVRFGAGGTQLFSNADVRIAGVRVGKVREVRPDGLRTDAELELEPRFAPLRQDARAILRTKTLLGETFVSLTPGSRTAPQVPEDGELPIGQVVEPQGVDRVLGTFDAPTRAAFQELLIGFAGALEGRGGDLNATFGNLEPASEDLRRLITTLSQRDGELRGLVRDSATTLRAIGSRPQALRRLIRAGDTVLQATASRDRELTATVRALPGVLREARATLLEVDRAAAEAAPTLRTLRPVIPLVEPALRESERLVPAATRVARQIPTVADAARAGLPATTRIVDEARPLLRTLRDAGRDLVPVLETLDAYKVDLVSAMAKLSAATQGTTGGHHYLRVLFLMFNESFLGHEQRLGSNRANAYQQPGALRRLAENGLESLDCSTSTNPQTIPVLGSGSPPCLEQGPWTLRGRTALLPAPLRDAP